MSVTSVPGLIAALSMKPVPPMLIRNIASKCEAIAAASQQPEPETPPAPRSDSPALDQRA